MLTEGRRRNASSPGVKTTLLFMHHVIKGLAIVTLNHSKKKSLQPHRHDTTKLQREKKKLFPILLGLVSHLQRYDKSLRLIAISIYFSFRCSFYCFILFC